jgi:hypothetical protein
MKGLHITTIAVQLVLHMLHAMLLAGRVYRIIQVCSKLPLEASTQYLRDEFPIGPLSTFWREGYEHTRADVSLLVVQAARCSIATFRGM